VKRFAVAVAVFAVAACTGPSPQAPVPSTSQQQPSTSGVTVTTSAPGPTPEQAFLDELRAHQVPMSRTGQPEVQVGRGICNQLAAGSKDATLVRELGAIGWTPEQAQRIVDAARAHLC
jgi:hypothetical protein